jgi:hypothetical protein
MERAMKWFNLYGREDVRRKLKNRQKPQKMTATSMPLESINPNDPRIHEIFTIFF